LPAKIKILTKEPSFNLATFYILCFQGILQTDHIPEIYIV
jgi:hypothetical protein